MTEHKMVPTFRPRVERVSLGQMTGPTWCQSCHKRTAIYFIWTPTFDQYARSCEECKDHVLAELG
jgi:hypothetical protein